MLDLLLEFNNNLRVPPARRYQLSLPGDSEHGEQGKEEGPTIDVSPAAASERLREAKQRLLAGSMTVDECNQLEEALRRGGQLAPRGDFASLLNRVPHSEEAHHTSSEDDLDSTLGFLAPAHEMNYIAAMDNGDGIITRVKERRSTLERDREAQIRNPLSVYNWLKQNQSHIFHHDTEPAPAAKQPTRSTGTRASKRGRASKVREEEMYDDEGIAVDTAPSSAGGRGKRKRDEDGGYRPKGGSGGRTKKKETLTKRTKRTSAAGSAA